MRIPLFAKFTKAMQFVGVLLVGIILGAALYHSLSLASLEKLMNERTILQAKLTQYEEDITHLNQFKDQHTVIKSILPRIENEKGQTSERPLLDQLTETEIIKRVKEDLSVFLGRSIFDIDSNAQFARKLLEKKVYSDINQKDYVIEIKTVLVVDNVLQVWLTVRTSIKKPAS
ncbi:hypothetical protein ACFSTH_07365 [Paenibacillus yanchengensis]|uniref:Sporulation membrane protein YtrI C-terminal domain-containing protein n=1 Tax=Paenibacillus yanchengensis TaxID=2035833 RepID=A0ABW4YLC3_9BACL